MCIGGTKTGEYLRTVEVLRNIFDNQGLYFVVAFLYDCQYTRADIKNILNLLKPKKKD